MCARDGCLRKEGLLRSLRPIAGQWRRDEQSRFGGKGRSGPHVPRVRQVLPVPGRRAGASSAALLLLPGGRVPAGSRGRRRRSPDDHARLEQLPRLDQRSSSQRGRDRRHPPVRVGLRRQPLLERHARPPHAAGRAAGGVHAPGRGRDLHDRVPGQSRDHRLPRQQGGHGLSRQARPRLHHRRSAARLRARAQVQAQRLRRPQAPDDDRR